MRGPAADAALDTRRSAPYFFGMVRPVDDILSELSWGRGYFPEEALRAALERGEQIVPHLIAAVERAVKEPDDVPITYVLHVCALFLLAEMRERRAYRPIVDLCRLSDDRLDSLLGDVPTEGLPQILASVAQEDDSLLRELVEDEANSPAVRVAALVLSENGADRVRARIGQSVVADDRIADARSRRAGTPVARCVVASPTFAMRAAVRPIADSCAAARRVVRRRPGRRPSEARRCSR